MIPLSTTTTMSQETKDYLHKRINHSVMWTISGVVLCTIILILMLNTKTGSVPDPQTAKDLRQLNNNVIEAKQAQQEQLKKAGDESLIRDEEQSVEIRSIHSDLKGYKIQSDAKINGINKYSSPDIISEFSKLQRQYDASKQPTADSTNDY